MNDVVDVGNKYFSKLINITNKYKIKNDNSTTLLDKQYHSQDSKDENIVPGDIEANNVHFLHKDSSVLSDYMTNWKIDEGIEFVIDFFKRMSYFNVLSLERGQQIKDKLVNSNSINVSDIIDTIREKKYTGIVEPQTFKLHRGSSCYWLETELHHPSSIVVKNIENTSDVELYHYLYEIFKNKPLSGHFLLVNRTTVELFTYLPYYRDIVDFNVYNISE